MRVSLACGILLAASTSAWAQPGTGTWASRRDMNDNGTPRAAVGHSTVAVDGYVYVSGGRTLTGTVNNYRHGLARLDPVADAWTIRTPIGGTGILWGGMAACAYDGAIYQFGGGHVTAYSFSAQCWKYDPAADAWTALVDLPTARQYASAIVIGDRIWVMGGFTLDGGLYNTAEVLVFDPADAQGMGSWSAGPSLPAQDAAGHGLRAFGAGVIGGKVVVAGGYAIATTLSSACYVYDTANPGAGWTPGSDLPSNFALGASAVADGRLYLMGGIVDWDGVYEYDPESDAWAARASMPAGRTYCSAATITTAGVEKIIVPGGVQLVSGGAGILQPTAFEFTPPERPRISDLRQSLPGGPDLPEGSWMGPMVQLAATATDSSGTDLFIEGQITPEGQAFGLGIDLRVQTTSGVPAWEVVGPIPGGAFRWRCRAVNGAGVAGSWVEFGVAGSGPDFQVDETPPTRVFGLEPSSRVRVHERHGGPVEFRWTPGVDDRGAPVTYEIEIDVLPTFVNSYPIPAVATPATLQVAPNLDQTMYYWRVRAVDSVGNRGDWSIPLIFQVYFDDGIAHAAGDASRVCGFGAPAAPGALAWTLLGLLALARRRR